MAVQRSTSPGTKGRFVSRDSSRAPVKPRPRSTWDEEARRIIRGEMERRGVSYKQLVGLIEEMPDLPPDFRLTERNLISRIMRGSFSFAFALQVLRALQVRTLDIDPSEAPVRGHRHG